MDPMAWNQGSGVDMSRGEVNDPSDNTRSDGATYSSTSSKTNRTRDLDAPHVNDCDEGGTGAGSDSDDDSAADGNF